SHYYDPSLLYFFSFTHTPPTKIYTLSLHDALPILDQGNTSATAGVQKDDTIFDQYFCNGSGGAATGGQSYTAQPCAPVPSSAVSRKVHGAAGTFDVPLPLTGNVGVECRSGGATNDY